MRHALVQASSVRTQLQSHAARAVSLGAAAGAAASSFGTALLATGARGASLGAAASSCGTALLAAGARAAAGGALLAGTALLTSARAARLERAAPPASPPAAASASGAAAASDAVLRSVVRAPFSSRLVAGLYTVELASPRAGAPTLVLLHGFANGSALFCLALDLLAPHFRVLAVDLRGAGASERPRWPFAPGAAGAREGEAWFVGALEAWRAALGLEELVLLGHSLGGYVAAAFALAHPSRVRHLVLASPVGVPGGARAREAADALRASSWAAGLAAWAWDRGVTPQSAVRAAGAWGAPRVAAALGARFGGAIAAHPRGGGVDAAALSRYMYVINSDDGSGERALSALLAFGAVAREPVGPRLEAAAPAFPVTFVYGAREHDWMLRVSPGEDTARALRAKGVDARVLYTPRAGHNLQIDNPEAFVGHVVARCLP
jgi:abhydrolase domain-containing protein 5